MVAFIVVALYCFVLMFTRCINDLTFISRTESYFLNNCSTCVQCNVGLSYVLLYLVGLLVLCLVFFLEGFMAALFNFPLASLELIS